MTLQELIDRASLQAAIRLGGGVTESLQLAAAALVPQVFNEAGRLFASKASTRSLLRKAKTVTFVNGATTVSSDALTRYKADSSLADTAAPAKLYAHVPEFADFTQISDTRLGYYCFRSESSLYVIEPDAAYEEGAGLSGDRQLLIPCVPAVPAAAGTTIDAAEEVTDELLRLLVDRLVLKPVEAVA